MVEVTRSLGRFLGEGLRWWRWGCVEFEVELELWVWMLGWRKIGAVR